MIFLSLANVIFYLGCSFEGRFAHIIMNGIGRIIREAYPEPWIDWDEAEQAGAPDRWFQTFQVYLLINKLSQHIKFLNNLTFNLLFLNVQRLYQWTPEHNDAIR